jgi:predicted MFS family arabinose efflux permease
MIGTFTTAFDVAQGVAGLLLGAVAAAAGYRASFGAAAGFAVVGLTLLLTRVGRAPADAQAEAEARRILDDPDAWIPPGVD